MSFGVETLRDYVNTWECDENVHLNVQFYWRQFGDAGRIFAHLAQAKPSRWTDRHVRYHRELGLGASTVVRSAAIKDGLALCHLMQNAGTGTLSATAVEQFATPFNARRFQVDALPEEARARGLAFGPLDTINTDEVIANGLGLVSHRSVIKPNECDGDGVMLDQFHISRFSNAAVHFWRHMGVDRSWMEERNFGSVAVEMKVTRHELPRSGMMIEVVTWLDQIAEKAFSFRHQVKDMSNDTVLYSGAVTALLMDLEARRVVPLPEVISKRR